MAFLKRGRAKRLVLDIGTSAIRLCELTQTKTGYQLSKYVQRELNVDPSWSEEEKLERSQEVLVGLLKEAKVRTRKTIVAVPGQSVFTRNRALPPVPEYKVTQIVRYEIQQQIPFSLDQIALDFQILDRTEVGGYDVMMAAIKVDVVEKQLEVLKKSKRSIDTVDIAPLAAYNWLRHSGEFGDDGQCVALVDMGATTTDIVVHKDNQFRFTRSLQIGGNDITSALATGFNLSFEEAEKLKRERGFAPTGDPKRDGKGGEVIGRITGRIVSELNRSLSYFRSQPGGSPVTRIILTGGGACLRNIVPYLQRMLNIEVRIAQPLAGLVVSPGANEASERPEQACVALGLALRCKEAVPIEINLIPPKVLDSTRRRQQAFYWFLSLATLFLIMASIVPVTKAKTTLEEERIAQLMRILTQYDPALQNNPAGRSIFEDEFMLVDNDVKGYMGDVKQLDTMRRNRTFWLDYLKAITDAIPVNGAIGISSFETAVFGGSSNTGPEVRAETMERERNASRGEDEEEQASIQYASGKSIKGFTGIAPPDSAASTDEPNGIMIYGYASDLKTLREFVDRLRESDAIMKHGVYFYVEFLDEVSSAQLSNARTEGGGSSSGGSGQGGGMSGALNPLGSLGAAAARNMASGTSASGTFEDIPEENVILFHIDVQFYGKPLNLELTDPWS